MRGATARAEGGWTIGAVIYTVRHGFAFAGSAALHVLVLATFLFIVFLDDYLDPPVMSSDAIDAGEGAEDWATAVPDPLDEHHGPFNVVIYTEEIPLVSVPTTLPTVEPVKKVSATPSAAGGNGSGSNGTGTGSKGEVVEGEEGKGSMGGGVAAKGDKRPCPDPVSQIVPTANGWAVERDLLDYYAGHPGEMEKLGRVTAAEDGLGGFRVGLTRCSILKQAGVKHGDIVRTINGRRVDSLPGAVATYFALRNVNKLTIHIVRKGTEMDLVYRVK